MHFPNDKSSINGSKNKNLKTYHLERGGSNMNKALFYIKYPTKLRMIPLTY